MRSLATCDICWNRPTRAVICYSPDYFVYEITLNHILKYSPAKNYCLNNLESVPENKK